MEKINIYESIGKRTGGDIYIGVVGPVRAGKSTFIKRFMELMVLPGITDVYEKERILDEMPQSGTGRTITTTEPKFIPAEAAPLKVSDNMHMKVRLVDCVGYLIPGAAGHMEDGRARMVSTPWSDEKIPFEQAAEKGTEKVIKDHSTVGIVITTDGSIGTMMRESYLKAEERVIEQLTQLGKPFVVILNTVRPRSSQTADICREMMKNYKVPVIAADCARMSGEELDEIMGTLLQCFPVREVIFQLPGYVEGLGTDHWLKSGLIANIKHWAENFNDAGDVIATAEDLADGQIVESTEVRSADMGTGEIKVRLDLAENLYYRIITEIMGEEISGDGEFFAMLREFSSAKKAYDKLRGAIQQVQQCGYGIVQPELGEMTLDEPEVFRQGSKYGVKLTAKAPTLHMIRTDITTEVSPVVGSEKQSQELASSLRAEMKESPGGIWNTNIFGKSLYEMVAEQMESKIASVPDNIRVKMQKSLQKISDEGKEYFICIVI